jgi:hypothetical protein
LVINGIIETDGNIISMKISLTIISFILLVASLVGIYQVYSRPTETDVTEEVTLLDYEHQGGFDYLVSMKPSHLYGPEPQETPPQPDLLKYPAEYIDHFNLTFSYKFIPDGPVSGTSEKVEVRAIVRSAGISGQKEIVLVPETSETGNFTISFPLNISADVSNSTIILGDNISGSEVTILADVYTIVDADLVPVFESYSQSLPLHLNGPLIEVEGDLVHTSTGNIGDLYYEQLGEFDYKVILRADSPFGAITLGPSSPTLTTPVQTVTLGPEDTIISRLIDAINMSFSYRFESSEPVKKLEETVTVEAVLASPEKWSKTIELVPEAIENGDFTVTFPLDLKAFTELFSTIQQETGTSSSSRILTIRAEVRVLADTDSGTIEAGFTPTISTDLTGDTLVWSGGLMQSEPGSITSTRVVPRTEKYLGMSVSQARILVPVIAGIFLVLFLAILWYFWRRSGGPYAEEQEAQQALNKYKNLVVETKELPEVKPGEVVILLNSLDDLVKTGEGLLKPILHKAEGQRQVYCVFDGSMRYEFRLT